MRLISMIICLACALFSCSDKTKVKPSELKEEITSDLKGNILEFWSKYSPDDKDGFYGELSYDGTPNAEAKRGLVLNARILWTFSSAYRIFGDESYKALADRAQKYLLANFIDRERGGAFWSLNSDGTPADTDKQTYGISFAIYGLSEHFRATGNQLSLDEAIYLYRTLEKYAKEPEYDGYIDSFTSDWQKPERYGYDGKGIAPKTMNTHIHVLEAYTSLYRVWKDPELASRLEALIGIVTEKMYNPQTGHLGLYFDMKWNSMEDIDSYGHDIETAWLVTEAAEVLGNSSLLKTITPKVLKMTDAALKEGLTPDGAMTYERKGNEYHRELSWWCQAETVVGCMNAWKLSGDERYYDSAIRTWNWIKTYMIDSEFGEWYGTVSPENIPVKDGQKCSMWRCPYHNSRMGYEVIRLLE